MSLPSYNIGSLDQQTNLWNFNCERFKPCY